MRYPSMLVTTLVLLSVAGCVVKSEKPHSSESSSIDQVKPDRSGVAFFDRPKAWAAAEQSGDPLPVLILLATDPWLMVIGSDSPKAALYNDGTFIYRVGEQYRSVLLSPAQSKALVDLVSPMSLPAGRYNAAPGWTDQPTNSLLVYAGAKPSFVSVYGDLGSRDVQARLPASVRRAFRLISTAAFGNSKPWLPSKIEVMIWPYEYAPERSIVWPKQWPGLHGPTTRKRGKDAFSLFLPASDLAQLRRFLNTKAEKGAVEIDGRKWTVSVRLPFPQEQLWMAPNLEAH